MSSIPKIDYAGAKARNEKLMGVIQQEFCIGDHISVAVGEDGDVQVRAPLSEACIDGVCLVDIPDIPCQESVYMCLTPEEAYLLGHALLSAAKYGGVGR